MKVVAILVLCAALVLSAHARPNAEQLRENLEKLKRYLTLETDFLDKELQSLDEISVLKRSKPYDDYDPDAEVLPKDYTVELTNQDLLDMLEEDVSDEELAQQEQEVDDLRTEIEVIENEQKKELAEMKRHLEQTEKRGIASVITWTITIGSNGYQLYNIVTRGCGTFPSICEDKNAIESLTRDIDALKAAYDTKYVDGLNEYLDLQTVMDNNWYIKYYIDEALHEMEEIDTIVQRTITYLNAKIVTLSTAHAAGDLTAEEYLDMVMGPLNMGLGDLEKMITEVQEGSAKILAINVGAQMLLSYWISSYSQARKQLGFDSDGRLDNIADPPITDKEKAAIDNPDAPDHTTARATVGSRIKGSMFSFSSYMKKSFRLVKRTFYNMATRPFVYISGGVKAAGGVKNYFSPRRIYNNFKAAALGKLKTSMTSIKNTWTKLKTGGLRQFSIKGFRVNWSATMTNAISAGLDIMAAYQSYDQWKQVSEEMAKQRILYEDYKAALIQQTADLTADMDQLNVEFTNAFENFQNLSESFTDVIRTATEHSEVVDATNIGFHYSLDNPLFSDSFFTGITKANIEGKQTHVLSFIRDDVNSDFFGAKEMLDGRKVFYEKCGEDFDSGMTVDETLADVVSIMEYSGSLDKANFGRSLSGRDIVCLYALVYSDSATYDFYDLSAMRPVCDITNSEWTALEENAKLGRYHSIVVREVQYDLNAGEKSVDTIKGHVVNAFNRYGITDMTSYASALETKDILCAIAALTSDQYFDYYELSLYRDNECKDITAQQFTQSQTDANSLRVKMSTVETYVNLCSPPINNCMCFDTMYLSVQATGITESELKFLIKQKRSDLTQWCATSLFYPTCNPMCVDLPN